jgi:hypothetical protein
MASCPSCCDCAQTYCRRMRAHLRCRRAASRTGASSRSRRCRSHSLTASYVASVINDRGQVVGLSYLWSMSRPRTTGAKHWGGQQMQVSRGSARTGKLQFDRMSKSALVVNSQANKRPRYSTHPSPVGRTSETREFSLCTELLGRGFSEVRLPHAPRRHTCYCSVCGIGGRSSYGG